MRVDLFDFELPPERIALHPAEPRDSARLLLVTPGKPFEDRIVTDLVDLIDPGDVLVINDTRVIPADLRGVRIRGDFRAEIAFNLVKRLDTSRWAAFARPAKRLKPGDRLVFDETAGRASASTEFEAKIEKLGEQGEVVLAFALSGTLLDEAVKSHGAMPLPPYIGTRRAVEERDRRDYQTVYARVDGAVAAPTAGLHFTEGLLARLRDKGVAIETVTLHVGAGTFLPVNVDDTKDHRMHAEWGVVPPDVVGRIGEAKRAGGRIVAVGTTSLRLLESAAQETGVLRPFSGETDIFITPGYRFLVVDMLMTNFHLPRSTLFMLVSAFSGLKTMKAVYAHAIEREYRFYSYGDASLLFRGEGNE